MNDAPNCLKSSIADDAPGITPLFPWLRCEHCIGSTQHAVTGHIVGTNRTLLRCSQCGKVREDVLAVAQHAQQSVAEQHADTEPAPAPAPVRGMSHWESHDLGEALVELKHVRAELAEVTAAHAQALATIAELRRENERLRDELSKVTAVYIDAVRMIAEMRREIDGKAKP